MQSIGFLKINDDKDACLSEGRAPHPESRLFRIRVRGQHDTCWFEWLESFDVKYVENGEMILSGYIADQAALLGLLNKLNRLTLTLLSVNEKSKMIEKEK